MMMTNQPAEDELDPVSAGVAHDRLILNGKAGFYYGESPVIPMASSESPPKA
jgi:hypothetical protein